MTDVTEQLLALLFVAEAPATLNQLALALNLTEGQIEQGLDLLESRLRNSGPLQLVQIAGGYQVCTKPEFDPLISEFLKPQRQKITRGLLEILAIVAYRQPVTVGDIERIRGVQSDYGVRALSERRLIQDVGRRQTIGRPILYGTTQQFLHSFNLKDLSQLPALKLENEQEPEISTKP